MVWIFHLLLSSLDACPVSPINIRTCVSNTPTPCIAQRRPAQTLRFRYPYEHVPARYVEPLSNQLKHNETEIATPINNNQHNKQVSLESTEAMPSKIVSLACGAAGPRHRASEQGHRLLRRALKG